MNEALGADSGSGSDQHQGNHGEGDGIVEHGGKAKPIPQPRRPTRSEIEQHELTHIPYRSWCVHCVRGAGRSDPHRGSKDDKDAEDRENAISTWSMDYCFMTDNAEMLTKKEMEQAGWERVKDTVIVCDDRRTGGVRAHLVCAKGASDAWVAGKIKSDMEDFGYGGVPIRLKTDQEPAIVDLQRAIISKREGAVTLPVNSPVGDSQSNGRVENAIKRVRNLVKVLKSNLEARWGIKVDREHPVYPWMFEWAADLITRYAEVGNTGRTAIQIIRGSTSSRGIAQFGEKILYMPLKLSTNQRGNMEDNYLDGIFLGMRLRSDEIIVGTTKGVIKARSIRRLVEEEQWDKEFARAILGSPKQPVPGVNSDHLPSVINERHRQVEDHCDGEAQQPDESADIGDIPVPIEQRTLNQPRPEQYRKMYVTSAMINKHGPTSGCPGCARMGTRKMAAHNDECRMRMKEELAKSEVGREQLQREQDREQAQLEKAVQAEVRRNPWLANELREHEEELEERKKRILHDREEETSNTKMARVEKEVRESNPAAHGADANEPSTSMEVSINRKRPAEVDVEDVDCMKEAPNARGGHSSSSVSGDVQEPGDFAKRNSTAQSSENSADGKDMDLGTFIGRWGGEDGGKSQVCESARQEAMIPRGKMDIRTKDEFGRDWDFSNVTMRNHAFRRVVTEKPFMLIGSPICSRWSNSMHLDWDTMDEETQGELMGKAAVHLKFVCKLYKLQHDGARYYMHEHSQGTQTGKEEFIRTITEHIGARFLVIEGGESGRRATGERSNCRHTMQLWLTNSPAMGATLNQRRETAQELCRAIDDGIQLQQQWDAKGQYLLAGLEADGTEKASEDLEESVPPEECFDEYLWKAWDDITGAELDVEKVRAARKLEMDYYDKMKVYTKVPISECIARTGKQPLKARWIDTDKGTRYRSRWVAKQFKGSDSEEWFAATPPIEALRALISDAASAKGQKSIMICDVSRAFFYAPVQHDIYVELCEEAKTGHADEGMCAKLLMSMYGTKAAAQNWQRKVQEIMERLGFQRGRSSPVLFYNHQRQLRCLIHGDDFVVSGKPTDLVWLRNALESMLEITTTIIGEEPEFAKEAKILNRTLKWHAGIGISYEADQKHAEVIIRETEAQKKTPLKTPIARAQGETEQEKSQDVNRIRKSGRLGCKASAKEVQQLSPEHTTQYRALAARANFLAIDRVDILYCAKELTRHMAEPTGEDWEKVVRLGRYLRGKPRVVVWYKYQEEHDSINTYSDTDWAGCKRTRRSTTGGYSTRGSHLIKVWCKTQAVVALSSAEAELYGLVRATSETMGLMSMYQDLGITIGGRVLGDASAALAIVARRGLGKLRHLDTNYLWIQEKAARKEIEFEKVHGKSNGADLFTKPLTWEEIKGHVERISSEFMIDGGADQGVHVNHMGAKPTGVDIPKVLQRLGMTNVQELKAWTRTDLGSKTMRTTLRGGPPWGSVLARITSKADTGELLNAERIQDIPRALEHSLLSQGPVDIQTTLVYRDPGGDGRYENGRGERETDRGNQIASR